MAVVVAMGCGDSSGTGAGHGADAGSLDAGSLDAGSLDAGQAEAGGPFDDADGDSLTDRQEGVFADVDTDGDGTPDYLDLDSDNDGLPDSLEAGDADVTTVPRDSDRDGTPNFRDLDSDDNRIPDADEGRGDFDGDGFLDAFDRDDDNDEIPDFAAVAGEGELGPNGERLDFDGDGAPDYQDVDSDNDTIGDLHEGIRDSDSDGVLDRFDDDSDGDGASDREEAGDADVLTPPLDTDEDRLPNYRDSDSDRDGLDDRDERIEGTDPLRGDTDNDGVSDWAELVFFSDPLDPASRPSEARAGFISIPFNDDPTPAAWVFAVDTSILLPDPNPQRIEVRLREFADDDGDALPFVRAVAARADAAGCTAGLSTLDANGDGIEETYEAVTPGSTVCWTLTLNRNTTIRDPETFLVLELEAFAGATVLETARVLLRVPFSLPAW
ncbi:MAG: hypothetical protein AAGF12_18010 [Myxococcota bacterium]